MSGAVSKPEHLAVSASWRGATPSWLRLVIALVFVRLSLKAVGLKRTHQILVRYVMTSHTPDTVPDEFLGSCAERVATVAAFFPGRALCLEQSLLLWYSLNRAGVRATLKCGLLTYRLRGHAWVEYGGVPVGEHGSRTDGFWTVMELAQ